MTYAINILTTIGLLQAGCLLILHSNTRQLYKALYISLLPCFFWILGFDLKQYAVDDACEFGNTIKTFVGRLILVVGMACGIIDAWNKNHEKRPAA